MTIQGKVRIAALADLHFSRTGRGTLQPLLANIGNAADVLLICGDLTHHGLATEAQLLLTELSVLRIPVLTVLGNHDHHGGEQEQIQKILEDGGIPVLDGEMAEVHGIGFAGVKGFGGGFGRRVLEPWGEPMVKQFVHESVNEALKLETALTRLKTPRRVVLLHYSPVATTVEGEPLEIFPFLDRAELEEPLNRFKVDVVFHGHAHHGCPEGRTDSGIPVFNVSYPLMSRGGPEQQPFRIFEIDPSAEPISAKSSAH